MRVEHISKPSDISRLTSLTELMAEHLLAAPGIQYHGADGMTVEDVVCAGYMAAVALGWVPDRETLINIYPELTDTILAFFRDQNYISTIEQSAARPSALSAFTQGPVKVCG